MIINNLVQVELYTGTQQASGLQADYRDTPFTRKKDGVSLPELEKDALKRFSVERWSEWSQIRLDQSRCFYLLPSRADEKTGEPGLLRMVLKSTVERVLGKSATPHQLLATYMTIPNGQVKNFLNACRTMNALRGKKAAKILVAGSKAVEGGGLWHKYFCLYLTTILESAEVHFMDYAEIEDTWELETQSSYVKAQWSVQGVDQQFIRAGKYDVLIDDVWTQSGGPGMKIKSLPEHFSLKGTAEIAEGFEPFLHQTETRRFSSNPRLYKGECKCILCSQIGRIVDTYEEYRQLRSLCARLGHATWCSGDLYYEQIKVSELLRAIFKMPKVEARGKAVLRPVMALTEEIGFEIDGMILKRNKKKPQFQPYLRFEKKEIDTSNGKIYSELEGLAVAFAGVPASILGRTRIKKTEGSAYVTSADVIFVSGFEVWSFYASYNQVYAPLPYERVKEKMPGWILGVGQVENFYHYYRAVIPVETPKAMKPYQRLKHHIYDAVKLFPFIQSQVLKVPLRGKSDKRIEGEKYTLRIQDGVMLIEEYTGDWRKSIFVNQQGDFSLMKEDPRGENDMYLLGLPQDVDSYPISLDQGLLWAQEWENEKDLFFIKAGYEAAMDSKVRKSKNKEKFALKYSDEIVIDGFLMTGFKLDSHLPHDGWTFYYDSYVAPLKKPPLKAFDRRSEELSRVTPESWTAKFVRERWKQQVIRASRGRKQ